MLQKSTSRKSSQKRECRATARSYCTRQTSATRQPAAQGHRAKKKRRGRARELHETVPKRNEADERRVSGGRRCRRRSRRARQLADARRARGGAAASRATWPATRSPRSASLTARACLGEGDVEGAVAEWTDSIALSGSHARCARIKSPGAGEPVARAAERAEVGRRARRRGGRAGRGRGAPAVPQGPRAPRGGAARRARRRRARGLARARRRRRARKLNKEEALELKRHKALAARRRTAYDKAVAERRARVTSTSASPRRWRRSRRAPRSSQGEGAGAARALLRDGGGVPRLAPRVRGPSTRSSTRGARKAGAASAPAPAGRSTPASSRRSFAPRVPFRRLRREYPSSTPSTRPLWSLTGGRRIGLGLPRGRARPSWWRTGGT